MKQIFSTLAPRINDRTLNATLEGSMKEVPLGLLPLDIGLSLFTAVRSLALGLKLSLSLLLGGRGEVRGHFAKGEWYA